MIETQFKKIYVLHNLNLPTTLVSSLFLRMHKSKDLPYREYHYPWKRAPMWSKHEYEAHVWPCALLWKLLSIRDCISVSPALALLRVTVFLDFNCHCSSASCQWLTFSYLIIFVALAASFISREMFLITPMELFAPCTIVELPQGTWICSGPQGGIDSTRYIPIDGIFHLQNGFERFVSDSRWVFNCHYHQDLMLVM